MDRPLEFDDLLEAYGDFYKPRFEVGVGEFRGGSYAESASYTDRSGLISGLTVDTALDRTNRVSFTLNGVYDMADREFDGDVESTFEEGAALQVSAGYGGGEPSTPLFLGAIDEVEPSFPADGAPTLSVTGYDLLQELADGTGTGNWSDEDLETVVDELTGDLPFSDRETGGSDVDLAQESHSEESDYAFLEGLAEENGFEFFSRAGKFFFREPATDRQPEVRLEYGRGLRSFTPSGEGGRPRVGTVKVRHVDEVKNEEIVGTAEVPGGGSDTRVESTPVRSREEAERRAGSIASRIASRNRNRGETLGIPELQIGRVVELGGLGSSYGGRYYVVSATHQLGSSGYTTSIEVRRGDDA